MALIATPGSPNANSYLTEAEAEAYWEIRPFSDTWNSSSQDKEGLLITATRLLDMMLSPMRRLVHPQPSSSSPFQSSYYIQRPTWTGSPSSATQALAWPRTGMFNRNGFPIASDAIPDDLKAAVSEFAGWLTKVDRFTENDVAVQGIASLRAGSVSISFREGIDVIRLLPTSVMMFLVPSWISDELIEQTGSFVFTVDR
jgi:hypothetical protein